MRLHLWLFASLISTAVGLTSCASTPSHPQFTDLNSAIEQAGALAEGGQTAEALKLLDAAASYDPSSAKPWVKRAQIQFQANEYAAAIESAAQAKSRDPSDSDARSIAIVAALRIAIGGLAELREQQGASGNAYLEAQRMAEVLKASIGTDALVPPEAATASGLVPATIAEPAAPAAAVPAEPRRKPVPRSAPKPVRKPAAEPAAPAAPAAPATGSGNPFKDLN